MTKTTAGESTMISPSSPKAVHSVIAKSAHVAKSEIKVKSARKPLSKAKPQRSSSFKCQSKSPLKPVIAKSQYNQCLSLLRDALVEYSPHNEASQLEILRNAKEYIIHLQQLIHYDDQQQIVVGKLDDLTF